MSDSRIQCECRRPLFGVRARSPCVFRRRTERGGFVEVRATPWAMPGLLHRSEKFEIHEVENQAFRLGLAYSDRVAKSNALVGRHFERLFAPAAALRARIHFQDTSRSTGPGRVDCCLGGPDRKPGFRSGAVIEMSNCSGETHGWRNCIFSGIKLELAESPV